ncbi:MAG: 3-phosphoglycerate dehydrogenase [Rhodospirillaceae bacterium]|jgi:D-3-phosphoglycerate dehydrogenase / 2-oxoglutarate reductase|nr:3-phosphoglycerate dehydrogenase [Rhodospirillaceae bacterium]MBT6136993.1 3-phosphoglycerate dehydrogenase [Rhodospirillaceae bacterium]
MTTKVLYFVKADEAFYDMIRGQMPEDYELMTMSVGDEAEETRLLASADAVIIGGYRLEGTHIAKAQRLRVALHQGVGYHDTCDWKSLAMRGVPLSLTPEGTSEGVSEHTIMMMLAAGRRLAFVDAELRQGRWHSNTFRSSARQLLGSTVGIIGLGRIGKQLAHRLGTFGVELLYTDLLEMGPDVERELNVTRVELDDLLSRSDFVTLHVPLTKLTHHMIDERALSLMASDAVLINCARGPVVKEAALVAALKAGTIGAVGLDVFEVEPPVHPTPFAEFPNVVMTAHHAPGTRDTMEMKFKTIFENLRRFEAGDEMTNTVDYQAEP